MKKKKIVKTVRLDVALNRRIASYAATSGLTEAEAIRKLLEIGLSSEGLSVFSTPLGGLVRDVIEGELGLFREELDEHEARIEERLAKVCSRGTKASLHAALQLLDLSRALIPAWRQVSAKSLWDAYSRAGGELQSGKPFDEVKAGMC